MDKIDMDLERFSANGFPASNTSVIAPLPPTVEMTGFSGRRHYFEQQTTSPYHKGQLAKHEFGITPLDSQCH
ncbi:hypothetical protein [Photobacterium minamisatsumaniensis]|uniref:hypothetical protein n=1 Tax=Photobacterium minamisatsumaniensis TaxID=2910233 RepID=UPI003D1090E7